jgi:glycosyltransferase involved in cell wall biosynthesis
MRRLVLATTVQSPGGLWRHVSDLATGMAERGWEVRLCLPRQAAELRELATRAGLALDTEPEADSSAVWHLHLGDTFDLRATRELLRRAAVERSAARVLTEHLPRTNASDASLLPGRRRAGASATKTSLKRLQYRCVHRVIAVSAGSGRFLTTRYGTAPELISVVENGVPADASPVSAPPGGSLHVVSFGSLILQKGHDVLIRAAGRARRDWSVTIVGEGPHRHELERLARSVCGGRVSMVGYRHDVRPFLQSADVVCVPSRWEASSYAALEAMQAGRAVVGTRVDGLEDIIAEGETGTLVATDDPGELAANLDALAADPARVARMGRAARRRVETCFGLDRMIDGVEQAYGRALACRR